MQSIVVALDEPHRERIEEAAGEIKAVSGRKDLAAATHPHFTLHVADRYEDAIDAALARIAGSTQSFPFETGRVGVFRGPRVVIALEVTRTEALLKFQEHVAEAVAPLAADARPAYAPDTWAPHIRIISGVIEEQHIDAIMAVLARRDFTWRPLLSNVCLVPAPRAPTWTRYDLRP
ncbi:MAG: 2'-5' RNA ligase family protein [Dehalococcoidia bacterium]